VKHVFNTSVGTLEVLIDRKSGTLAIHRFDDQHRAVAAAYESWDHVDLLDVLNRQIGVPLTEANRLVDELRRHRLALGSLAERLKCLGRERGASNSLEKAGIALRFVAVLLDGLLVLLPLAIIVGLMSGGGYTASGDGTVSSGVTIDGNAVWLLLAFALAYYVACEAATGMTLGKRLVGIRVVDEEGADMTFAAALIRNLLRLVDALFFYLIGFLFALASPRGQRLGDRAAHTIVVRS
jgi:uncharacterized RDD family membrane protein YckC